MKKRVIACLLALAMVFVLAACGSSTSENSTTESTTSSNSSGDAEYVWKMAVPGSKGTSGYDMAEYFSEKISELTDGRVQVEIYGGSQLGTTTEVLEGMGAGVADIMVESIGTLAPFTDLANIDAFPYLYQSYDQFMNVWSSDLGQEMRDTIGESAGFKLLGYSYRGPRIVTATKNMSTIEDFKGFKLRTPNLDIYVKTWEYLGATPTPLAMSETYTALQQGTVDGQENSIIDSVGFALDEVCDYWIKTNHVYSCNVVIMDISYFSSLPEDIQQAVNEAAIYAGETISQETKDKEASTEQELINEGKTIVEVDTQAFADYFSNFASETYPDIPEFSDWSSRISAMK